MENTPTGRVPDVEERRWWTMLHSCLDITYNNLKQYGSGDGTRALIEETLARMHLHAVEWDRQHQAELLTCCDVLRDMHEYGAKIDERYIEWID
jgi:hypothetical protein